MSKHGRALVAMSGGVDSSVAAVLLHEDQSYVLRECRMTCWRRLRDRQHAGVWAKLHHALLDRLGTAGYTGW